MGKWILFFIASAIGHVLVFLTSGFAMMLGVFAMWCFAALIFWDMADSWPKTCEVLKTREPVSRSTDQTFRAVLEATRELTAGAADPRICPECGKPNSRDRDYCSQCGTLFNQEGAETWQDIP